MYLQLAKKYLFNTLASIALVAFAGGSLIATAVADDKLPHQKPDESWITISGKVQTVDPDRFNLDYGEGMVTVEMDDGDRDADAYKLLKGDKVTVTGKIDDDFFETTTIEASSVYVENLNTTFFASAEDEEDVEVLDVGYLPPLEIARTTIRGTVTDVSLTDFTLDTGTRKMQIEIENMPYNPLDDEGYQKIEVGDRVRVVGHTDIDFLEGRVFDADSVIKLYQRES